MSAGDPRGTWAWRRLRTRVVHEEPACTLRLPGCTSASTTADHIIPYADRPDLAMARANLRGSCRHCNQKRGRDRMPVPGRPDYARRWVL